MEIDVFVVVGCMVWFLQNCGHIQDVNANLITDEVLMKTRRKRYQAECPKCKALRKMAVVGASDNEQYIWLRCSSCHLTFLFPATWFDNGTMVRPPLEEFDLAAANMRTVVEYSLHKRFNLGQLIYHKRFNDVGQVIAKEQNGDNSRIVVQFKRCGEKTLVEGLSPA